MTVLVTIDFHLVLEEGRMRKPGPLFLHHLFTHGICTQIIPFIAVTRCLHRVIKELKFYFPKIKEIFPVFGEFSVSTASPQELNILVNHSDKQEAGSVEGNESLKMALVKHSSRTAVSNKQQSTTKGFRLFMF